MAMRKFAVWNTQWARLSHSFAANLCEPICARLGRIIIHFDAGSSALNFVALKAAKQTLLALKIPVMTGGLDLGDLLPSAPFNFGGISPGDEEFAELLSWADFIRWLKTRD